MYQLISITAFVLGAVLVGRQLFRIGYNARELFLLLFVSFPSFFIGARLLNYLLNIKTYQEKGLPLWTLRYVGFSIYGGILLTLVLLFIVLRLIKKDPWQFADQLWFPFALSFAIMRLGCYINGCCYGLPTDFSFGISKPLLSEKENLVLRLLGKPIPTIHIHPTQLYELIGAFIPAVILLIVSRRRKMKPGVAALLYGICFTTMRLIVLPYRDLPYPAWVQHWGYPLLYALLIAIAIALIHQRKRAG